MRHLKTLIFGVMVMMLATTAWAASPADHVKVAPNKQGDVLIYPFYAAIEGGFETKLTVVNTSRTESTVAKLVVRSEVHSQELLDFLIYLSPSDVWTGTLKWDAAEGGPVMYSDDDSVLSAPDTWASADQPVNQPLIDPEGAGDTNMMGYVYVINAATTGDLETVTGNKVAKSTIKDWYDDLSSADIRDNYQPKNILAGFMDFNVEDAFLTSGLNAYTLRDYGSQQKLTVAEETYLGEIANNNLFEVEAAMAKKDASIPYINTDEDVSLHFFNFPTKYTEIEDGAVTGVRSPYFNSHAKGNEYCVPYNYNAYDLEENTVRDPSPIFSPAPPEDTSQFCRELAWVDSPQFQFEEGFTRYTPQEQGPTHGETVGGDEIAFTGVPFIPMQLNLGDSGLSMKYGSWTDGVVTKTVEGEAYEMEDYKYSDYYGFTN